MRYIHGKIVKDMYYVIYNKTYKEFIICKGFNKSMPESVQAYFAIQMNDHILDIGAINTDDEEHERLKNDLIWKLSPDEILNHVIMENI